MIFQSRKFARLIAVFIFALAVLFLRDTTPAAEQTDLREDTLYSISRIIDGDTIKIKTGGQNETVRLIGLDTPETVDPRRPVECFGKEASEKAKSILSGEKVRIETDPSQGLRDKYGRLLAYVFLSDGTLFNKMMIEEGYGHEYTYHLPYKYQKEFKAAEQTARELKKGLWADGVCE